MSIYDTYRIVLFGHHDFCEERMLDKILCSLLIDLIRKKDFVEIYVGRNGDFDIYAASLVKNVQKAMGKGNNEFICVLPYRVKDIENYEEYYDSVIIPECIEKTHPKAAITKRNRWMVEQANILICYVKREKGGAYTALKYAKKLKKKIFNLAEWEHKEE